MPFRVLAAAVIAAIGAPLAQACPASRPPGCVESILSYTVEAATITARATPETCDFDTSQPLRVRLSITRGSDAPVGDFVECPDSRSCELAVSLPHPTVEWEDYLFRWQAASDPWPAGYNRTTAGGCMSQGVRADCPPPAMPCAGWDVCSAVGISDPFCP